MTDKKNTKVIVSILVFCVVCLLCVIAYDTVNRMNTKETLTNIGNKTNKVKKEVTVTDEGIADAVEKMYDTTVIVRIVKGNQTSGWGSGFVYKTDDKDAYILTNHHVVDGADKAVVEFTNGESVTATIKGSDPYHDVALLTVPKEKAIEVAEIGSSKNLRVGDTVFAVGTPVSLSYSFTVTRGILSGKNRLVQFSDSDSQKNYGFGTSSSESWYMSLLQIDASINSGNSGGPLANSNGEVIGITNSKLSNTYTGASIENMGFAIPIEDAIFVAEKIEAGTLDTKKVLLGVSMITLEAAEANDIKIDPMITFGAVVQDVSKGSNADRAGIKPGDVIIEFNGEKVDDYRYLKYYLYKCSIGDKVTFKYIRNGKTLESSVVLKG